MPTTARRKPTATSGAGRRVQRGLIAWFDWSPLSCPKLVRGRNGGAGDCDGQQLGAVLKLDFRVVLCECKYVRVRSSNTDSPPPLPHRPDSTRLGSRHPPEGLIRAMFFYSEYIFSCRLYSGANTIGGATMTVTGDGAPVRWKLDVQTRKETPEHDEDDPCLSA